MLENVYAVGGLVQRLREAQARSGGGRSPILEHLFAEADREAAPLVPALASIVREIESRLPAPAPEPRHGAGQQQDPPPGLVAGAEDKTVTFDPLS